MNPTPVIEETTKELILFIKNRGNLSQFNKDVDKLYTYLYQNKLQSKISGPTIGLFYSKEEGDYIAAVSIKEKIFTSLENPATYSVDEKNKNLISDKKSGVKAPSFLTRFTKGDFLLGYLSPIKVVKGFHQKDFRFINETFYLLFAYIKKRKLNWYFPVIEKYHYLGNNLYQTEILIPLEKKEVIRVIS